jgi:hypothetical protein
MTVRRTLFLIGRYGQVFARAFAAAFTSLSCSRWLNRKCRRGVLTRTCESGSGTDAPLPHEAMPDGVKA